MLSNLPSMDYYRGGWPVCLSVYPTCLALPGLSGLVWCGLVCLSYLTIRSSHVHAHAMILRGTIPFLLYLTVPTVYTESLPAWSVYLVWSGLSGLSGRFDRQTWFFLFCSFLSIFFSFLFFCLTFDRFLKIP